ncbi:MAG: DUF2927 domain-containing protein [Pseudomonadota bacterium]
MRRFLLPLAMVLNACVPMSGSNTASRTMIAETTLPPMKTFAARVPAAPPVSNRALVRDFLDLSFQLESGRPLPVMTRFEEPISLRVTGVAPATLMPDLRALLGRLQKEAGISIALTDQSSANITIEMVSLDEIHRVLPQAICFVAPNVSSLREFKQARRSPRTDWATLTTREQLAIVIPRDVSPQEIRDCLHEELAQALGPLNDLYKLPNSVFNDDNVHTVLTRFDMLVLRATYAPELRSGMRRDEVSEVLPSILRRLNPGGEFGAAPPPSPTPQAYIEAIQEALGPGASAAARRAAAKDALTIARTENWQDSRLGFAHYALGRALQATDARAAHQQFQQADAVYGRSRATRLHRAFVATQLAAYALTAGDPARARAIVAPQIPHAREAQNAALLATLQLLNAQALETEGKITKANAERLDSLGWARYGFGADWAVESKLREISALNQSAPPV